MSASRCSQNYHLAQQGFRLALVANTYQHYNTFRDVSMSRQKEGHNQQQKFTFSNP